ncbi:MAG: hypothetical protein ACXWC9_08720 [Pseudobdellovibrionaceae bacterium]
MDQGISNPPQLCSMSLCDKGLFFHPRIPWPEGLPAVAVNQVVLAGFSQNLVFNHQVEMSDGEAIARLFRSLYFELSFVEMAQLTIAAGAYPWFPISAIAQKFSWQANDSFFKTAEKVLKTPQGFLDWAAEKKISPQDFAPLLSSDSLELKFLFHDIVSLHLSRSLGVKALELGIELMLIGQAPEALTSEMLVPIHPRDLSVGEAWVQELKILRYPETFKRDLAAEAQMTSLPWPGTTQARWTRQGDRAGIELKLFVSQPSDLKKYLQSLNKVQDLLEKDPSGTKH